MKILFENMFCKCPLPGRLTLHLSFLLSPFPLGAGGWILLLYFYIFPSLNHLIQFNINSVELRVMDTLGAVAAMMSYSTSHHCTVILTLKAESKSTASFKKSHPASDKWTIPLSCTCTEYFLESEILNQRVWSLDGENKMNDQLFL